MSNLRIQISTQTHNIKTLPTPRPLYAGTHSIEAWVSPKSDLDSWEKSPLPLPRIKFWIVESVAQITKEKSKKTAKRATI